ncbi:pentapeptide repeat-containing protein [Coleofasciculus sp.]|uniref:pentapeptide repeat-containing protein n=1 Tax=Coleofasciculus sp. TaxID=3100458 RepID=UPI0039F74EDC
MTGANLSNAYLHEALLDSANLSQANLSNAYLREVVIIDARLDNANLEGVNLNRTDLSGVNLENINLSNANLSHSVFMGVNQRNLNSMMGFSRLSRTCGGKAYISDSFPKNIVLKALPHKVSNNNQVCLSP